MMRRRMRKIQFDSWITGGKKSLICILIMFMTTMLLSTTLYFYKGNALKESLINSMELSMKIQNDHYFSGNDKVEGGYDGTLVDREWFVKSYPEMNYEFYQLIIPALHKLMKEDGIQYGNFNIEKTFQLQDGRNYPFFGIETKDFLSKHKLTIIDGTDEINEEECIVSLSQTIEENGVKRPVKIGDALELYGRVIDGVDGFLSGNRVTTGGVKDDIVPNHYVLMKTLVVKGIYENEDNRYAVRTEDDFSGSNGILVWNKTIEDILNHYPIQYGYQFIDREYNIATTSDHQLKILDGPEYVDENGNIKTDALLNLIDRGEIIGGVSVGMDTSLVYCPNLNNIEIIASSMEDYETLQKKLAMFMQTYDSELDTLLEKFVPESHIGIYPNTLTHNNFNKQFTIMPNNLALSLEAIDKIVTFFEVIMISILIILLISLFSFLNYLQLGKKREIFIYYSLGKKKSSILKYYAGYYLKPAMMIGIPGILCGYLNATVLSHWILVSNLTRQKQFIHENTAELGKGLSMFKMILTTTVTVGSVSMLMVCVFILLFVVISTMRILHGKLRDHARGGN